MARNFNPAAPDVTWAGDITYIPTGEGWLFLSTVIDLYSRRVIGWGLAEHLRTPLVSAALEMAVATRGGHVDGVVFHSDRGCQYTSAEYRQLCDRLAVTQSMGATGICLLSGYSSGACSERALISWEGACITAGRVGYGCLSWRTARRCGLNATATASCWPASTKIVSGWSTTI